ncbi:MAG: WYL domain-containing protein [Saprospiraceae bacterium]|nr:WYL domain-containing protein [Saprospiraceae bacterium]
MATNNHALIRYMTIDRCLKSGGTYHLKDLIDACSDAISGYEESRQKEAVIKSKSVSRRTVLYDLEFMKDEEFGFGAPIQSDKMDGYYYNDPRFEIFRARIAHSDLDELSHILLILKRISGGGEFKDLESVLTRLEETYHIRRSQNTQPIISFEHSTNIDGQKWINSLKKFIQSKQTIAINYAPFSKEAYDRFLSPYLIKEYNNRWFLIGYDHDAELISNLGLDRIIELRGSIRSYYQDPHFNGEVHLNDIIGVSIDPEKEKETITFKAINNQHHYLRTKPLHHSQKTLEFADTHGVFTIEVIPNFELESKLLGFGERVLVLEPEWLREKLIERVERMREGYRG